MSPIEAVAYVIKERIAAMGPYRVLVFKEDDETFHIRAYKSQHHVIATCVYELNSEPYDAATIAVRFQLCGTVLKRESFDMADPDSSDELVKWVEGQFRM